MDLAREVVHPRNREASNEFSSTHHARQLEQGQRVSARFRHDSVTDPRIDVTEIYAERNQKLAVNVAREVG